MARRIFADLFFVGVGIAIIAGLTAYESGLKQAVYRSVFLAMFLVQTGWIALFLINVVRTRRIRHSDVGFAALSVAYGTGLHTLSVDAFLLHIEMSSVLGVVIGLLILAARKSGTDDD